MGAVRTRPCCVPARRGAAGEGGGRNVARWRRGSRFHGVAQPRAARWPAPGRRRRATQGARHERTTQEATGPGCGVDGCRPCNARGDAAHAAGRTTPHDKTPPDTRHGARHGARSHETARAHARTRRRAPTHPAAPRRHARRRPLDGLKKARGHARKAKSVACRQLTAGGWGTRPVTGRGCGEGGMWGAGRRAGAKHRSLCAAYGYIGAGRVRRRRRCSPPHTAQSRRRIPPASRCLPA